MLPFVLKTADEKLKLRYNFINLMSNVLSWKQWRQMTHPAEVGVT